MNSPVSRLTAPCVLALAGLLAQMPAHADDNAPGDANNMQIQSSPYGVYFGGTAGIGVWNWDCTGESSCNRAVFSGKIFGAKRLTPTLAAEVNYFEFGQVVRDSNPGSVNSTNVEEDKRSAHALGLGISWETELLFGFTNQLRVGWAHGSEKNSVMDASGNVTTDKRSFDAPYLGAGLAYQLTHELRLLSNADYIIKGHDHLLLLSLGASADF